MCGLTWSVFVCKVVKKVNGFHLKKCPDDLLDLGGSPCPPDSKDSSQQGDTEEDLLLRSDFLNESEESISPLPPPLPSLVELCRKRKVCSLKYDYTLNTLLCPAITFSTPTKTHLHP